jgi:hypothetical protein
MEAEMTRPAISSDAPANAFTGSAESRFFGIGANDVEQARVKARVRAAAPEEARPSDWSGMYLRITIDQSDSLRIFNAIQSLYLSMNRPRDREIAERITELHRVVLAEGEQISALSLEQFTEFLLRHPDLRFPRITMTPNGTLRTRWIQGPENFVAIEFTGKSLVRLVAEVPREGGQTASYFASEPMDSVVAVSRAIGGSL